MKRESSIRGETMNVGKEYKTFIIIVSIVVAALLGVLDYITAPEIAIFYLLPVFLSAWYAGKWAGVSLSLFCSAIWLYDNLLTGLTYDINPYVPFWEATVRLGFFLVFSYTVSKLHDALREERVLSRTDDTTRIANKKHFAEFAAFELRKLERYGHPLTLAFMDVDNFKTVNDELGHHEGDVLLRLIAGTIQDTLRATDMVARVGGDEFTILFPETGAEAAREVVGKLRKRLMDAVEQKNYPVTFSIGVVSFLTAPRSIDDAIRFADGVMYRAKKSGKNRIMHEVYGEMEDALTAR